MPLSPSPAQAQATLSASPAGAIPEQPLRLRSDSLMQGHKEMEIDHAGKIYRLRITQLNKLILTA